MLCKQISYDLPYLWSKQFKLQKIPASALAYAITFLLLVGLVCTGVLFTASVNKRLEVNFAMEEHLVFDNLFAINYGAQLESNSQLTLSHINGDSTDLSIKSWGAYKVVVANTFHRSKSITKTALIGNSSLFSFATIFLPDQRQTLKVCGSTKISGNAYLSERGLERGHIAGKSYSNDKLIYGELRKSEKYLPELFENVKNLSLENFRLNTQKIEFPIIDTVFSFKTKTAFISEIEPIILSQKIQGNVIIHSFESITINASAKLENVILISPKVIFDDGFKGSLQVIAHEQVLLGKNVQLQYPSTITINELTPNTNREPRGVFMEEGSNVIGGILLVSQKPDFRNPLQLEMNNSIIGGLVYNVGETMVKGKIHGFIYTNSFMLKTGGGEYKNHLLDAEISSIELPKEFILPQWIKHSDKMKGEIITWF